MSCRPGIFERWYHPSRVHKAALVVRSFGAEFITGPGWPLDTKDILVMLSDMDINAIAGTLKLYFRELPEPLLTDRLYPAFMEGICETGFHLCARPLSWTQPDVMCLFLSSLLQLCPTPRPRKTAWCTSYARCPTPTSWPSSLCWSTSNGTLIVYWPLHAMHLSQYRSHTCIFTQQEWLRWSQSFSPLSGRCHFVPYRLLMLS